MHAVEYMKSVQRSERSKIAKAAGFSDSYINKLTFTKAEFVPLRLAIACTKHSFGKCDFWASVDPAIVEHTDWLFLRDEIDRMLRKSRAA